MERLPPGKTGPAELAQAGSEAQKTAAASALQVAMQLLATGRDGYRPCMGFTVAVVGATGAVGREMIATLERRNFPVDELRALASSRSAGQTITFRGKPVTVQALAADSFKGVELALFSAGGNISKEYGPIAAKAGALVVDNSSAWRMDPDTPLVIPEVNLAAARNRKSGIIANPNCSTIQMLVALKPLHDAAGIKHIVVSTYQATSGKGHAAVTELLEQSRDVLDGKKADPKVFPIPIAFNAVSDWKAGEQDYSEEEWKMVNETRKILGDPTLAISPTTVRVPVVNAHSESVHVQFKRPMTPAEAKKLLAHAPGVQLHDADYAPGKHPHALEASGTDAVHVGRIRADIGVPGALNLWIVGDNLRKGAALNAVQIAEAVLAT